MIDCNNVSIQDQTSNGSSCNCKLENEQQEDKSNPSPGKWNKQQNVNVGTVQAFELPSARLKPDLHSPHKRPDLLFSHCLSVSLSVTSMWADTQ